MNIIRQFLIATAAIIANISNPFTVLELSEVQAAASALGLEVDKLEIRRAQDWQANRQAA